MSSSDGKQPGNVARGLKATIHNDHVSDEAKQSAAQRLEQMGAEVPSDFNYSSGGGKNTGSSGGGGGGDEYSGDLSSNQIRGYKSTLSRGNVSREAKEHARQVLEGNTGEEDAEYTPDDGGRAGEGGYTRASYVDEQDDYGTNENDGSKNRVLGGYKAALKNPNVSDGAKQHAHEVLEDAGAI